MDIYLTLPQFSPTHQHSTPTIILSYPSLYLTYRELTSVSMSFYENMCLEIMQNNLVKPLGDMKYVGRPKNLLDQSMRRNFLIYRKMSAMMITDSPLTRPAPPRSSYRKSKEPPGVRIVSHRTVLGQ